MKLDTHALSLTLCFARTITVQRGEATGGGGGGGADICQYCLMRLVEVEHWSCIELLNNY